MRSNKYQQQKKEQKIRCVRAVFAWIVVFLIFFAGTGGVLFVDNVCLETTRQGGNLTMYMEK